VAHGKVAKNEIRKNLMIDQHASPITPMTQGNIPRKSSEKSNEQASQKKVRIFFHLCCNPYAFKQNIHTPNE
jgi:hypothetical protein